MADKDNPPSTSSALLLKEVADSSTTTTTAEMNDQDNIKPTTTTRKPPSLSATTITKSKIVASKPEEISSSASREKNDEKEKNKDDDKKKPAIVSAATTQTTKGPPAATHASLLPDEDKMDDGSPASEMEEDTKTKESQPLSPEERTDESNPSDKNDDHKEKHTAASGMNDSENSETAIITGQLALQQRQRQELINKIRNDPQMKESLRFVQIRAKIDLLSGTPQTAWWPCLLLWKKRAELDAWAPFFTHLFGPRHHAAVTQQLEEIVMEHDDPNSPKKPSAKLLATLLGGDWQDGIGPSNRIREGSVPHTNATVERLREFARLATALEDRAPGLKKLALFLAAIFDPAVQRLEVTKQEEPRNETQAPKGSNEKHETKPVASVKTKPGFAAIQPRPSSEKQSRTLGKAPTSQSKQQQMPQTSLKNTQLKAAPSASASNTSNTKSSSKAPTSQPTTRSKTGVVVGQSQKKRAAAEVEAENTSRKTKKYQRALPTGSLLPMDVICSQSQSDQNNPGNHKYNDLIIQYRDQYRRSSRSQKTALTRQVIASVQNFGGRFVRHDDRTKKWVEIDEDAQRLKVSHALRYFKVPASDAQKAAMGAATVGAAAAAAAPRQQKTTTNYSARSSPSPPPPPPQVVHQQKQQQQPHHYAKSPPSYSVKAAPTTVQQQQPQQQGHSSTAYNNPSPEPEPTLQSLNESDIALLSSPSPLSTVNLALYTQQLMALVRARYPRVLDLNECAATIGAPKRVLREICNILEGAGLVQEKSAKIVELKQPPSWSMPAALLDRQEQLRSNISSLQQDEAILDQWMALLSKKAAATPRSIHASDIVRAQLYPSISTGAAGYVRHTLFEDNEQDEKTSSRRGFLVVHPPSNSNSVCCLPPGNPERQLYIGSRSGAQRRGLPVADAEQGLVHDHSDEEEEPPRKKRRVFSLARNSAVTSRNTKSKSPVPVNSNNNNKLGVYVIPTVFDEGAQTVRAAGAQSVETTTSTTDCATWTAFEDETLTRSIVFSPEVEAAAKRRPLSFCNNHLGEEDEEMDEATLQRTEERFAKLLGTHNSNASSSRNSGNTAANNVVWQAALSMMDVGISDYFVKTS